MAATASAYLNPLFPFLLIKELEFILGCDVSAKILRLSVSLTTTNANEIETELIMW